MALKVEKTMIMSRADIIRYQLFTHCFTKNIKVSDAEINCLTLLGLLGEQELAEFCILPEVSDQDIRNKLGKTYDREKDGKGIYASAQAVRNFLTKAEKINLLIKNGKSRKKIQLNPEMEVLCAGTILLNYKIAHIDPQES